MDKKSKIQYVEECLLDEVQYITCMNCENLDKEDTSCGSCKLARCMEDNNFELSKKDALKIAEKIVNLLED